MVLVSQLCIVNAFFYRPEYRVVFSVTARRGRIRSGFQVLTLREQGSFVNEIPVRRMLKGLTNRKWGQTVRGAKAGRMVTQREE